MHAVSQWLHLKERYEPARPVYSLSQLSADVDHSSLLRRLLAGKEPLPEPPPRSFSYPWYEIVEQGHAERCCAYFNDGEVTINQCSDWTIVEWGETTWTVTHPGAPGQWILWYADALHSDFGWRMQRV